VRIELAGGEGNALAGGCASAAERVAMGMAADSLFLAVVVERNSGDSQRAVRGTGRAQGTLWATFAESQRCCSGSAAWRRRRRRLRRRQCPSGRGFVCQHDLSRCGRSGGASRVGIGASDATPSCCATPSSPATPARTATPPCTATPRSSHQHAVKPLSSHACSKAARQQSLT
jgi:hypothetical protein